MGRRWCAAAAPQAQAPCPGGAAACTGPHGMADAECLNGGSRRPAATTLHTPPIQHGPSVRGRGSRRFRRPRHPCEIYSQAPPMPRLGSGCHRRRGILRTGNRPGRRRTSGPAVRPHGAFCLMAYASSLSQGTPAFHPARHGGAARPAQAPPLATRNRAAAPARDPRICRHAYEDRN